MKLDLNRIKDQLSEYHIQVAEIFSGFDAELERQKLEINKIKIIEIELLKLIDRIDKIEKQINNKKSL